MKKLLLTILLVPMIASASDFDRGYEVGWEQGWKQVQGRLSLAPLAPLAPLPPLGEDSFLGGYNEGFLAGIAAASRGY
jgi:hypothetical protein